MHAKEAKRENNNNNNFKALNNEKANFLSRFF